MKDLMTPRYEVIADYPESKFKIGQTVTLKEIHPYSGYSFISGDFVLSPEWFDKYPHLFRKLQWYEKRDIKDMPEYVKYVDSNELNRLSEKEWEGMFSFINNNDSIGCQLLKKLNKALPATKSEYDNYINSKI